MIFQHCRPPSAETPEEMTQVKTVGNPKKKAKLDDHNCIKIVLTFHSIPQKTSDGKVPVSHR